MTSTLFLTILCLCFCIFGCGGKYQEIKVDIAKQDQCVPEPFARNNYFSGKLLTANDFQDEQDYHIGKQNLHNRFLHDWGVVCGLWVMPSAEYDERVILTSGIAIDGEGHEIIVPKPISIPIPAQEKDLYIAIEYKPLFTGFVPNLNDEGKQPTRTEESFDFAILKDLPDEYVSTKDIIENSEYGDIIGAIFRNHTTCCPKTMPVILAKISANNGKISEKNIDNISYRRLILNSHDIAILLAKSSRKK